MLFKPFDIELIANSNFQKGCLTISQIDIEICCITTTVKILYARCFGNIKDPPRRKDKCELSMKPRRRALNFNETLHNQ